MEASDNLSLQLELDSARGYEGYLLGLTQLSLRAAVRPVISQSEELSLVIVIEMNHREN